MNQYTLPRDEQLVRAEALTYAHFDGLRDFPDKIMRTTEEIIAKAHSYCDKWEGEQGQAFCNDLAAFRQLFTACYGPIYNHQIETYRQKPQKYRDDLRAFRQLGGEQAYPLHRAVVLQQLDEAQKQARKKKK